MGDPKFVCLSTVLHGEQLGRLCAEALGFAWAFVYDRLMHLFIFVDPTAWYKKDVRVRCCTSRRLIALTERGVQICLLFYVAVFACCIDAQSRGYRVSASPNAIGVNNAGTSESSSIASDRSVQSCAALNAAACCSATVMDLFMLLCPLQKCEFPELRNIAVSALGFTFTASLFVEHPMRKLTKGRLSVTLYRRRR